MSDWNASSASVADFPSSSASGWPLDVASAPSAAFLEAGDAFAFSAFDAAAAAPTDWTTASSSSHAAAAAAAAATTIEWADAAEMSAADFSNQAASSDVFGNHNEGMFLSSSSSSSNNMNGNENIISSSSSGFGFTGMFDTQEDAGFKPPPPAGPPPPHVKSGWDVDFSNGFNGSSSSIDNGDDSNTLLSLGEVAVAAPSADNTFGVALAPHPIAAVLAFPSFDFDNAASTASSDTAAFTADAGGWRVEGDTVYKDTSSPSVPRGSDGVTNSTASVTTLAHFDTCASDVKPTFSSDFPPFSDDFGNGSGFFAAENSSNINAVSAGAAAPSVETANAFPLSSFGETIIPSQHVQCPTPPALPVWDSGMYEEAVNVSMGAWSADGELGHIISPKGQDNEVQPALLLLACSTQRIILSTPPLYH
jgi:hypothetical protein